MKTRPRLRSFMPELVLVIWLVCLSFIAHESYTYISSLTQQSSKIETIGEGVSSRALNAADKVKDLPIVGDEVARPFQTFSQSGKDIAQTGKDLSATIKTGAKYSVIFILTVPLVPWVLVVFTRRMRIMSAQRMLRRATNPQKLLAYRAVYSSSLSDALSVSPDPQTLLERGEYSLLARAELKKLRLREVRN